MLMKLLQDPVREVSKTGLIVDLIVPLSDMFTQPV